jgi:hypothetical protein
MISNRFITVIFSIFFIFISNFCIAQIDTSLEYVRFPKDHQLRIITDRNKQIKYVLDTAHIYIEAIARNGARIWKIDPWKDANIKAYIRERPVIISFVLRNDPTTKFTDVLMINYDNLGGAQIDAKTGKILRIGQD